MSFDLEAAHKLSWRHRKAIESSTLCGCFYCLSTFAPTEITEWTDGEQTALCPRCWIDSVLGSASDVSLTTEFLSAMRKRWFQSS
jgi:hypothetical protein